MTTNASKLDVLARNIVKAENDIKAAVGTSLERAIFAGGLLAKVDDLLPHGERTKWVEVNIGLSKRTAQVYKRLYRGRDEIAKAQDSAPLTIDTALRLLQTGDFDTLASSDSPEWYTPEEVVGRVVEVLDGIDLDPCSNTGSPNIPARRYFTEVDDGLAHNWSGKVYMNPPFGKGIEQWVKKLVVQYEGGDVTEAIAMLPDHTSSAWFQPLWNFLVLFASPRVKFIDGSGKRNPANTHGSAIVYLGDRPERFCEVFEDMGVVASRFRIEQPAELATA